MLYRLFPLIVVLALAAGVRIGKTADVRPMPSHQPIPFVILPSELFLPNWLIQDAPYWRLAHGPLAEVRVYGPGEELEVNEIDAKCLDCRQPAQGTMFLVALLVAIATLITQQLASFATNRWLIRS